MKRQSLPQRWLFAVLEWFCPPALYEMIEGDLIEQYELDRERYGKTKAARKLIFNGLKFFRPGILLRNVFSRHLLNTAMLYHFFKFLIRGMRRNAIYSSINISGLALGLATVLLISIYVLDERSFDRFHPDADDIYRVVSTIQSDGNDLHTAFSPSPLCPTLQSDLAGVELATRVSYFTANTIEYGQNSIKSQGIEADPDFLKMFSFEFVEGDSHGSLDREDAIVITEDLAQKLFGRENALNKIVNVGDRQLLITGILKSLPQNSHLQFGFIVRYLSKTLNWGAFGLFNYIKVRKGTAAKDLERQVQKVFATNFNKIPELRGIRVDLRLQPLTDIHLDTIDYQTERPGKGNKQYVIIFSLLAIFVLVIACINFTNLSTARAIKRAKEIGLRKTIGAIRSQLIVQLLGESLVAATVSFAIALVIAMLLLQPFNTLTQKSIALNYESMMMPVVICFLATLTTGVLAGLYPAAVLSSIRPSSLVKGSANTTVGIGRFSKALVVVQFTFSIGIIAGTFVVYSQLQYIRSKNLGFQKENILNIHSFSDSYPSFKTAILKYPGILSVSAADQHLSDVFVAGPLDWPGKLPDQQVVISELEVDYDFIETMKMEILKGRSFQRSHPTDKDAFIVNEEALKILKFEDPIGQQLNIGNGKYPIIGVVKDFHFRSVHEKVGPIVINVGKTVYRNTMIRVEGDIATRVKEIQAEWTKFNPDKPFEFSFLDEDFDTVYRAEAVTDSIFKYFSALAIVIACLGLFGLSAYTVERKNKEYSIRKVFGASSRQLFYRASVDHIVLVIVAFVISIPFSYYLMERWLGTFAYHTDLTPAPFMVAGVSALLMALLTVSYQALKVALHNPSNVLRSE